jgi:SAM-dependent methyltransferase
VKQFAEACERNREPILAVLRRELDGCRRVLEIGSGTGQHAVYFARHLPDVVWQPSDRAECHASIRAWIDEAGLSNVAPPLELDVERTPWPVDAADAVFSANTAHILAWEAVEAMIRGVARVLVPGGRFCLYGPFSFGGRHTAESNERFDEWLKARDPRSGVRDFGDLDRVASEAELEFVADHPMPANNRLLVWAKPAR